MQKVISFCLWGESPKYCHGAVRNAALAQYIYPDWQARFYVGADVPSKTVEQLEYYSAELWSMPYGFEGWKGMFARFLPASDESVDVFISRDCDSRLSVREALAVQDWIQSPKLVHSMGDHPYHFNPSQGLMGGMFGMKRYACPDMAVLITEFITSYPNVWQCDQSFLRDIIWPKIYHKVLAHSDIHSGCNAFPKQRIGLEFVGKIFLEDESTILDHEEALKKVL